MSRVYDNWEKLVGAVLKREELRRLARCESFSSSISAGFSSRFSVDFSLEYGLDLSSRSFVGGVPADSRNSSKTFDPADPSSQSIFFSRNVMAMEFDEIKKAIKNYPGDMVFGKGGFCPVLKGWIHEHYHTAADPRSGIAVAVKKWTEDGMEWSNEINFLSQLRHPNLVKLIGYSFEKGNRISVYEFVTRMSLNNHLFRGCQSRSWATNQSLPWAIRIKIAVGAARALSFLHDLAIPVIHRDFQSSNILLDDKYNVKLSNFGRAIDGPTGETAHVSAEVVDAFDCFAPEYVATGRMTTKCDVYSFGVVLLELLSGLRSYDMKCVGAEQNLVDWARPHLVHKKTFLRIMDPGLRDYPYKGAYKVAKLAYKCLSSLPEQRPRMAEVVVALEQLSCDVKRAADDY